MIDVLRHHIIKRLGANTPNVELVLSKFQSIEVKRNEELVTQGTVCKYVYFIAQGCLQVYVYDKDIE